MLVTAWVLLIMFGLMVLASTFKYMFGDGLNKLEVVIYMFAIFVVAVSAGIIWGGLFQDHTTFVPANFEVPMLKRP